MKEMTL